MNPEIREIPIDQIRILNPRKRDARKFGKVVESIETLGLKKPIKVSIRKSRGGGEPTYDLVYGQGRLEAFKGMGHQTIPAIIVDLPKEDRLLLSLVENMARRVPKCSDLMDEILRFREQGLTNTEIGKRLGIASDSVSAYITLRQTGEERLLQAALRGTIPVTTAIEISRIQDIEAQRAFLEAYQSNRLSRNSIRSIKRVMDQRRLVGKDVPKRVGRTKTSAETIIHMYRKLTDQQRRTATKARACEQKLMFVVTALKRLLGDEDFRNLLRAERMDSLPEFIAQKVDSIHAEAA
jgi:ParB family chromosome partitioning protein